MYFIKRTPLIFSGITSMEITNNDKISKESDTTKGIDYNIATETGWERLKNMFSIDEFGAISSELNSIYQAGFLGFFIGAIYGGVINSRNAYVNFMENNEATAFKSHLDAKRKLQDEFTVNFAKGALRWGWRIALFTTSYAGITTCIAVYREKSSIYEYLAAGTITGACYKVSLGLRGITVGGLVGCVLGGIAGGASLLILKTSGTTMQEVRYWQYKWKLDRLQTVKESIDANANIDTEMMKKHDSKIDVSNTLENVK